MVAYVQVSEVLFRIGNGQETLKKQKQNTPHSFLLKPRNSANYIPENSRISLRNGARGSDRSDRKKGSPGSPIGTP